MIDDDEAYGLYCDIGRLEVENARLRTQLADVTESMGRVEERCAKLRKVVNLISEYISYDRCEGCVVKTACNNHEFDMCWMVTELHNQLRELGVETDA